MKLQQDATSTNAAWMERWSKVLLQNYAPAPVAFVRGKGSQMWDAEGKAYLDFAAGVAVCSTGHAHPRVVGAIQRQAAELLHTSNLYLIPNQIQLAEELVALSGLHRAFFCNSGTEAMEAAMKLARYWGHQNGGRFEFITTDHGFHGRTFGALTLTRNPKYQQGFEPLLPGVREVAYSNLEATKQAISSKTCAVVIEPVQGEGGVNVPEPGYLKGLREVCDDAGILLVLDEVQTGIGRLGEWFGFQREGIRPDIVALAKGLGGGFPIGAILASERASVFTPGSHGSTFGGNALACAAALATLAVVRDERLLENVRRQGAHLLAGLSRLEPGTVLRKARGAGLLQGFDLSVGKGKDFVGALLGHGLLATYLGERTVRLAPPLVVTKSEVDQGLRLLAEVLGDFAAQAE